MVTVQRGKRSRGSNQTAVKSIKVEFSDEPVASFSGLALVERLALRLGLWRELDRWLPERRSDYSWGAIIKSAVAVLLTVSRGMGASGGGRVRGRWPNGRMRVWRLRRRLFALPVWRRFTVDFAGG